MSSQRDYKNFRGKDIDFEDQKFEPFPSYRLKANAFETLERLIVPQKLELMVANLEYIGSRKMADLDSLEAIENNMSFITNEFSRAWLAPGAEAYMTDVQELMQEFSKAVGGDTGADFSLPFLVPSIHDDDSKAAILVSPHCFEKNPDLPEIVMLN